MYMYVRYLISVVSFCQSRSLTPDPSHTQTLEHKKMTVVPSKGKLKQLKIDATKSKAIISNSPVSSPKKKTKTTANRMSVPIDLLKDSDSLKRFGTN